jgi:hypothetical protein
MNIGYIIEFSMKYNAKYNVYIHDPCHPSRSDVFMAEGPLHLIALVFSFVQYKKTIR